MTQERFQKLVTTAQFPVICANARLKENNVPILPTRIIFDEDGVRVAVFGLTTTDAQSYPAFGDKFVVAEPISAAKEMVQQLKSEGVDLIVALTHIGHEEDLALAKDVPEIDVIVGGHSHTRVAEPVLISHGDPEPHDINATVVVQDFQWGGELGRLDLTLYRQDDGSYDVMTAKGHLIPITSNLPPDEKVAKVVDRLYQPMRPVYDVVLGEATGDLANSGFERSTVNLVADIMREVTGADVALQNYGGVRGSITQGPIKMWDIASLLPFNNKIVVLRMTGKRLREGLTNGKEFLGVSGMKVVWSEEVPITIEVGGSPLDEAKVYSVATIDYIQNACFADVKDVTATDMPQRETVAECIKKKGKIAPVLDGRCTQAPK